MVDPPNDRGEPFFVTTPGSFGVLAWLDHRSYSVSLQTGKIELYVAPVNYDLTTAAPTVIKHARFIAGTSELNGVEAGSNVILGWLDERNGKGILDPRAEVWLDTAWY